MTNIIKSIQQIAIAVSAGSASNTATISAVTTANTEIWYNGFNSGDGVSVWGKIGARAIVTNTTTITVTRDLSSGTSSLTVYLTIVEYQSSALNSSIQSGTITLASVASNTATISSVTTTNSVCTYMGWSNADTGDNFPGREFCAATLTNATTVTGIRGQAPTNTAKVNFQVTEYVGSVLNSSTQKFATSLSTTATSLAVTISSVTTANTLLRFGGFTIGGTGTLNATDIFYTLQLTGATTVTLTRIGTNNTNTRIYYYTVLEFVSGVLATNAVQRGTIAITNATSATAAITTVNLSYAAVNWCSFKMGLVASLPGTKFSAVNLSDSTHVQATMNSTDSTANTSSYEVIEFAAPSTGSVVTWSPSASLAAVGSSVNNQKFTMSPAGSLVAKGNVLVPTVATWSPAGSLAAKGKVLIPIVATWSPHGSLAAVGKSLAKGKLTASPSASLAAKGISTDNGKVTFSPSVTLAAVGKSINNSKLTLSPAFSLNVVGRGVISTKLTINSSATFAFVSSTPGRAVIFSAIATLSAVGVSVKAASATFSPKVTAVFGGSSASSKKTEVFGGALHWKKRKNYEYDLFAEEEKFREETRRKIRELFIPPALPEQETLFPEIQSEMVIGRTFGGVISKHTEEVEHRNRDDEILFLVSHLN